MDTTESLLRNICKYAPDLNGREVSNIFWSLGQLRLNFGEMIRPIEAEPGSLELDEDWLIEEQELYTALEASLCECVRKRASSFIAYDLESTLSGLAHTSVNKLQLATVLLELTPNLIARLSDKTVNSFFFVNVMSSLSLMPVRLAIYTIVGQTDATLCLNATLEATLVDYALQKFHVFNGRQFPTLLMSLSRLGLSVNRLSSFQQGRLTAVLSRILMSLDAEGMVASLLALQRMGFSWRDHFVSPSQSQSNSPVTEALGGRVLAYVRSNIGSFREVDISLLIFALGRLGLDWGTVDGAFERKVSNRLARIARFLPLTRAALTIQGLELMKVKWTNLSANITQSLDAALPVIISGSTAKDQVDLAVLLRSSQAIKYVDMVAILQSTNISSKLQEPVDQSFVATHTCSTVDFHMEGLLRRYSTQTS